MANEKEKCPICGTKLKMINGRMTCKQCGYYVRGEAAPDYNAGAQSQTTQSSYTAAQPTYNGSTTVRESGSQSFNTADSSTPRTPATPQPLPTPQRSGYSHGSNTGKRVALVIGIILGINLISSVIIALLGFRSGSSNESSSQASYSSNNSISSGRESESADSSQSTDQNSRYMPKSDFFRELAEAIFDRPYITISRDQFARIVDLTMNEDHTTIYYELDDGTYDYLTVASTEGIDLSDLKYFTGLEWLELPGLSLSPGDLDGLDFLYGLYCDNTLQELSRIVPDPESIYQLGVKGSALETSLDGVENFPNLLSLSVDYNWLQDISALEQLPDLRALYLENCGRLENFDALMTLTNLEYLRIESENLMTMDFVQFMPNLIYLSIEDSQALSIDSLSGCPNLLYLDLEYNNKVTDYTVIEGLTQLTNLTLFHNSYEDVMPAFDNLTQLQSLSLSRLYDDDALKTVSGLTDLTSLYLKDCSGTNLEYIGQLPQLASLSLIDCYFYREHQLEPLAQLPLVSLDLTSSIVTDDYINVIFDIPTLRYLYMDELKCAIDFNNLPYNESLVELSMNGIRLCTVEDSNTYLKLADHYDMFANFPELIWLYLKSNEIDSIEFVQYLPNLEQLDIGYNNVTSLKPLESLSYFWLVHCEKNTILEDVSKDSRITVVR